MSELKTVWVNDTCKHDFQTAGGGGGVATKMVEEVDAQAALAERDKRIAELEELVEKMKCCQNCGAFRKVKESHLCGMHGYCGKKNWKEAGR